MWNVFLIPEHCLFHLKASSEPTQQTCRPVCVKWVFKEEDICGETWRTDENLKLWENEAHSRESIHLRSTSSRTDTICHLPDNYLQFNNVLQIYNASPTWYKLPPYNSTTWFNISPMWWEWQWFRVPSTQQMKIMACVSIGFQQIHFKMLLS